MGSINSSHIGETLTFKDEGNTELKPTSDSR